MFYPITASTDDRGRRGCVPLVLRNVVVEPQPTGAGKRTEHFIAPSMGRVSRVTPSAGDNIRGVFSRPGVCQGRLLVAAGSKLFQVSSAWNAAELGPIGAADGTALFDSIGAKAVIVSDGAIFEVSESLVLSGNADPEAPPDAYTLAALGERALSSEEGSEQFDWSSVSNALDWPASGFAASARMPDEIRRQVVLGGDLFHFGANTIQPWRAMGGDDADAFDILNVTIDRGIITRDAGEKVDGSFVFVGDDRVIYALNGYQPVRISNREIEQELAALTEAEVQTLQSFAYLQGSHVFWVLRMPGEVSYCYDLMSQTWSERSTWETDRYAPAYYTYYHAAGKHVVASPDDDAIYTFEEDVYDDAGEPIERIMMLHIPVAQRTIISSLCLDIKCTDVPLTGRGVDPIATITTYTDGGSRDSLSTRGVERVMQLGKRGNFARRPIIYRLGMVNAADGLIVKIRITDPINFTLSGVWINEDPT